MSERYTSDAPLAGALRRVHRDVGVPEQVVRRIGTRRARDADAGVDVHLVAAEQERRLHRLAEPLHQRRRVHRTALLQEDRELVAAESRHRVGHPGARAEPLGRGDEQPVAHLVAQAVVHLLEVVEVEEQHRQRVPVAAGERQRMADPVAEERPVGEPGERVVERLVDQLLLQPLPLAHVAGVEHDPRTVGSSSRLVAMISAWSAEPSGWRKRHSTGRRRPASAPPRR